jgi:hypothetical protein
MSRRGRFRAVRLRTTVVRAALVAGTVGALAAVVVTSGAGSVATVRTSADPSSSCRLGNGVQHVINIVFDNVHFSRDNPNVPSDLEQMPHLFDFLKQYGTVFSNSHTPLIAHTADDSLTIYTGLYGDRHGQPVTNSYKTYNPDGTTDPAGSFAYWTSPVFDTAQTPRAGHDTTPSMVYSDVSPGSGAPTRVTPAPWVPFTRAGCSVGDFSTANMVLENAGIDLPTVFGASSPEVAQANSDSDSFKDAELADYIGEAIHCAKADAICANAQAMKYGRSTASASAVADQLPTEPGGYSGFQALFGHRYVAPQLGAGTPNVTHHGYEVTNAAGNLVDLDGNQINGAFLGNHPGFPGFNPTATQTLAMLADMQEAGVPVTYGYISDLHERKPNTSGCTTATATKVGNPLGPGDSCYVDNAKAYDKAFATFFDRLKADGITPANTVFVIGAEENDQFAGANVGRAIEPAPANCDGVDTACSYASGQIGELQANIEGLLAGTASESTAFDIEPQGAAIYVHGNPPANDPTVRQLERDTAAMTADDPYSGVDGEKIAAYQAGALEQRVLHLQTADPLRFPTYTIFPKPDYFFSTSGANVGVNSAFAYDHGYYSPNIDVTWVAIAGKGVAANGVDGPSPADGNQPQDPESKNTVPQASTGGTWVEETDIRPTLLYLVGLADDYRSDGHVITQALRSVPASLEATEKLAAAYDQINSSVGRFATDTLIADTRALASGSARDDHTWKVEQTILSGLAADRDRAAERIKAVLADAAAGHTPNVGQIISGIALTRELLIRARTLSAVTH